MARLSRWNHLFSYKLANANQFVHYGLATFSVSLAALLQIVINEITGRQAIFLLFFGAIMVSAWYGGLLPGLLASGLSGLMASYFFLAPFYSFEINDPGQVLLFVLFIVEAILISVLSGMRLQAQENEYEQRQRLHTTLYSIGDGVIATDIHGRVTFMNPVAEQLTGWTITGALGENIADIFRIVNETTREIVALPTVEALQKGIITGLANHTLLLAKDGREIPIDDSGAPIKNSEGAVIGSVLVFRDISDRKSIEHRIQLLQQIMGVLAEAVTPSQVADVLIEQSLQLLNPHIITVVSLSENRREIQVLSQKGVPADILQAYQRIPLSASVPLTDAIRMERPIWLETLSAYQQHYPKIVEDAQGQTGTQALIAIPMMVNRQVVGGIGMSFPQPRLFDADERSFILALAQQGAQALARAQQAQQEAAVEERQRLARELHDSVSQVLFSASIMAESLPRLWQNQPERAAERTQEVVILNRGVLAEMRTLLLELRPEAITRYKLSDLIHQLIEAALVRKKLQVEMDVDEIDNLRPDVQVTFYRVAQEIINNSLKHSDAKKLTVKLKNQEGHIMLFVGDDGKGFDVKEVMAGLGLTTMQERTADINATLTIESTPEQGTKTTLVWKETSKFEHDSEPINS